MPPRGARALFAAAGCPERKRKPGFDSISLIGWISRVNPNSYPRPGQRPGVASTQNLVRSSRRGLRWMAAWLGALLASAPSRGDHGSFTLSSAIYRIPYGDGLVVTANNDHHNHPNVRDRVDLGAGPGSPVVAAASGIIRAIVDFNGDDPEEHSCTDDTTVAGDCSDYNNYVWIEHPNGEWTKYTHLETGSVTIRGWMVGDTIYVGETIGLESDVGAATGPHLHFEVAIPNDPNDPTPFSTLGGFIQGVNVVTVVCFSDGDDDGDSLYTDGESYTAGPCVNTPPTSVAGGPYAVAEGSAIQLDGTASSDPHNAILTYAWSPVENLDDPSSPTPTFSGVDDAVVEVTLSVNDVGGDVTAQLALSDEDTATVTVLNVAPTVTATGDTIVEGAAATVSATFTDPGLLDTHTATIDWGDGTPVEAVDVGLLAAGIEHVYGDNGTYEVTVTVTDDDNGSGADVVSVVVANVKPFLTLEIEEVVSFPGGDYFVVGAGSELPLSAEASDLGSDDLTFAWSVGDENIYYNDGSGPDPFPSPSGVFPFAAADAIDAVYAAPGAEVLGLELRDDDGGSSQAEAGVIVTGTASKAEHSGWWKHQYAGVGSTQLDAATAGGYLEIVNAVSGVFSETVSLATAADAHAVLSPKSGDRRARARAALLIAWLQFASGAVSWDAVVPQGGGSSVGFLALMSASESAISAGATTAAQLLEVERRLGKVGKAD